MDPHPALPHDAVVPYSITILATVADGLVAFTEGFGSMLNVGLFSPWGASKVA